jgi:hypothetical protein
MKLFRGIAVPNDQLEPVIEDIKLNGIIDGSKANWQTRQEKHFKNLNTLHLNPNLSTKDTRPKDGHANAVCACGEKDGALYYATKHNLYGDNNSPIIIEINTDKSLLSIDGKDFLYTAFQYSNPEKARPILEKCFGSAILKYVNRAWSSNNQSFRVAQCDLAIQDIEVIEAHHASKTVIAGRAKTIFRNAFTIKLPVLPASILSVCSPNMLSTIPHPDIYLDNIMPQRNI